MKKLAAACLVAAGCSAVFMETVPKDYQAKQTPRCTGSRGLVALDVLGAVGDGIAIGIFASATSMETTATMMNSNNGAIIAIGAVEGVVHLISAIAGAGWATDCDKARADHDRYLEGVVTPRRTTDAGVDATPADAGVDAVLVDAP